MSQIIALPLIAIVAILLSKVPAIAQFGLSALPLAIILGIVVGHLNTRKTADKEVIFTRFCQQKLLRAGIILFGFSLSFQQIISVGWQALVLDLLVITSIFCVGTYVGIRFFKLDRELAILTSVGSAICGAAAILATESVLKPRQQSVTVAVATVVLFGTLAMFSYPFIFQFSGMSEQAFGIYIGSTVHEVAQAVAAGEAIGGEALQNAVVVKLIRVMMLAPFILILSAFLTRSSDGSSGGKIAIPWFVFGFIAASGLNSLLLLPEALLSTLQLASQFSLAIAMAALGVQTRWSTIRQAGVKPMVLSLMLFVMLIFGGFYLNQWLIVV
ncbi:YeiH family protein [Neptunomonas japonica]|uniref:Uncharacterized protein n=1 Tax=Neptunomonas japonica JAMM 1380 TaxID=1441457 RepID=A0A7R6PJE0_9GAMM|nr:YeiH family protein [Neptunomonas japonica]BBB30201.1 conserved hypothetical protein [Neptunomonas japonica JAMM 1380]